MKLESMKNKVILTLKNLNIKDSFTYVIIALLFILVFHSSYFIFGENSKLTVHDNLDSNIAWVKVVIENDLVFQSPQQSSASIMNNGNYASFYGCYDFNIVWFRLFGMYNGYAISKLMQSIIAFIGMFLLLKTHFNNESKTNLVSFLCALMFACLPFWSFTLSVAGSPFLLLAFLNIRSHSKHKYNWLIITLFPFVSSLFLIGVFFIFVFSIVLVYDTLRTKTINKNFLFSLFLLSVLYVLSHSPLFYLFFFTDFISHRTEQMFLKTDLTTSIKFFKSMLFSGQYHAPSFHYYLLPFILLAYLLKRSLKQTLLIAFILITSLLYGFYNWDYIYVVKSEFVKIIPIQFQRFHFLHPLFWYILFAISAFILINKYRKIGLVAVSVLSIFQLSILWNRHETRDENNKVSFHQFYTEEIMLAVKNEITNTTPNAKVLTIGLYPSVLKYNGIMTLGSYSPNYEVSYKKTFRDIIEKEIEKDTSIMDYYDNWGSRCYAFSSELGKNFLKPKTDKIENLDFNYGQIKLLGADYIVSSVAILNEDSLHLINNYSNQDSYWNIYLYKIK